MLWNIFVDRYAYIQHFSCCLVFWGFRPDTPWGPWKSTLFPDYIPALLHEANTYDQAKAAPFSELYTRCRGGDPVKYWYMQQAATHDCLMFGPAHMPEEILFVVLLLHVVFHSHTIRYISDVNIIVTTIVAQNYYNNYYNNSLQIIFVKWNNQKFYQY